MGEKKRYEATIMDFSKPWIVHVHESDKIWVIQESKFLLEFQNPTLRDQWFTLYQTAIQHNHHHGNQQLNWIPNEQVSICMICLETKFNFFIRRHHCRSCGNVICFWCLRFKESIRYCIQCC
jgi:hypothetical protein